FYSCLLCQSFAPDHVCIITPERLGLCGAYNWLDGKAAFEINETGPNQPVVKGKCLDPVKGVWQGVDDYVYINSHKMVRSFCAYSIMDRPMTSCGCFEAICAYVPELNGVMVVNREFQGDTPVGMTFSTLAGTVGGGQQTPGFMGVGKVFLTSRKFLFTEGGYRRLAWMPKELKDLLGDDLKKRFTEQGIPDMFDKIADETIATEAADILKFMQRIKHPALEMEDMAIFSTSAATDENEAGVPDEQPYEKPEQSSVDEISSPAVTKELINEIKRQVIEEMTKELKSAVTKEVVQDIILTLNRKFLGEDTSALFSQQDSDGSYIIQEKTSSTTPEFKIPYALERLSSLKELKIRKEKCEVPVWEVTLGATKKEGGTRGMIHKIGGATCMPYHLWEGNMPNRPLVAMEVFDKVSDKFPAVLRELYGDLLERPAEMAKVCVEKYGADLISVRLEGTHPEKGNYPGKKAVEVVKSVLKEVRVPLIITGHNHFERNNEVMKAVAQAFAGENLLLNWVEQENYRTIAGSAVAYGHTIVAQSPIDVNIAKQMNILLTNMDVPKEKIVIDPMTGASGYGIEYTYSVMERIRLTGLNGDRMLAGPMIVTPGQECYKIKEFKATEKEFPMWGDLGKRAALWELSTAVSLLYAGADLLIMYHPEAAMAVKRAITRLMD
ncbi:MAG: acetyl-CoA decarbonylase/synthase complex subunit delta, partial [Bacteroidetes bacterium]|nr:acetyl-CoA decarbonylase/synthase complex subunit delta [Bacteroidota bacterium]